MGRGGPAEPELIDGGSQTVGVEELLRRADAGQHAASDFLEDAALARVATVGARRCGGGLLGRPFVSNVVRAVRAGGCPRPRPGGAGGIGRRGAAGGEPTARCWCRARPPASPLGRGFGAGTACC